MGLAVVILMAFAMLDVTSGSPEFLTGRAQPSPVYTEAPPAHVPSTPVEAALDELRRRFPDRVVIGFEELFDPRPESEPQIDLGPSDATFEDVLSRIRRVDPKYRVELLEGNLIHVYPATRSADPAGLLDIRLHEFFLPPADCMAQQVINMDNPFSSFSYTPELSAYLSQKKEAWYRAQGKPFGFAGDFMGDCEPAKHRREPIYHNITVREALNLMAVRSLQVARGEIPSSAPSWFKPKPISWKYRFRRDPTADTGLDGVPVFQAF